MHILFIVILFILGASWGSFLNVIAYRKSLNKTFLRGRSHCPACGRVLYWYDMVPIFSFLWLRGKCRFCGRAISVQYLLVELCVGAIFVLGGLMIVDLKEMVLYVIAASFFVVLFLYDAIAYIVPDSFAVPAIAAVFLLNAWSGADPLILFVGGVIGGGWFLAQFAVSKGRWVGGGDIRIGVLIGVLVGYPLIFLALGLSYITGSIAAAFLIVFKKKSLKSRLPFATVLLPCSFVVWLWGRQIWNWYVNLIA